MFLTVDDYRPVCDQYEFEQITQNEDIRLAAEAAAVEQITAMTLTACFLRSVHAATLWSCSVR